MKRSMIRICGAAMAGLVGILAKNQAFAVCSIYTSAQQTVVWLSSSCSRNALTKVCSGHVGSTVWDRGTADYSGYCWCRNVLSDYSRGEIACMVCTGDACKMFNTLTGAGGCGSWSDATAIILASSVYGASCNDSQDACYYDASAACARTFATTGEAVNNLSGCCKPCYTGSALTGLDMGSGVVYLGAWTVSGNGGIGIDTCVYSAPSVTDKYGTFVAGKGTLYRCNPGSGTGTGM